MALLNRLSKSKLRFIFIFIFVISLFFILKNNFMQASLNESDFEQSAKPVGVTSIPKSIDADVAPPKEEIIKEPSDVWRPMGDEATKAKIIDWFESRGVYGFYGPDEQNDYKNYDIESLKKLSESGDIRAMHLLAEKAESISGSNQILYNAAVYGSTGALSRIGLSIETEFDIRNKSPEERRPYIMESLAYYEAAQLRGDWWANIQGRESLLNRYPTDLSLDEKSNIQKRAQEIYAALQQRREEVGLGKFDNSVPDEVIKFYEEMLRPL